MISTQKTALGICALTLAGIGFALFRPDTLIVNKQVNEALPVAGASRQVQALEMGQFRSGAHKTTGAAAILRTGDGNRVLRLTQFETSNGPDVHVYLVAAPDVKDDATVKTAGFIDLGSIKGNQGDQNYPIPDSVDLRKYRTVTIWCARFGVNFGSAPLMRSSSQMASAQMAR